MKFKVGLGKNEITCFIPGLGMMGYGQPHNIIKDVATPLMARVLILQEADSILILAHLDLAFASQSISEEILRLSQAQFPAMNLTEKNIIVTATHTHSAPGGYSQYPFYNFTIPGHRKDVLNTICEGTLLAITEAYENLSEAHISFGEISIHPDKEVAYNRSLSAHQNNTEKTECFKHLAIDRRMRGLLLRTPEGKLRGILNWFGVHGTSISSQNHSIHHDNKGIAADLFEKSHAGTIAFFLQSAAGDVSPNFIWDKKFSRMRGKFKDQYESAAFNGEIQFREAEKIEDQKPVEGTLKMAHHFFDMSLAASIPAHGVDFFAGTAEGPGIPKYLIPLLKRWSAIVANLKNLRSPEENKHFYKEHFPKKIMLDHRDGSILGFPLKFWNLLPKLPIQVLENIRKTARSGSLKTLPWVPFIVPFQLIRIGPLLMATIPGEITTMAARRLEKKLLRELSPIGISNVLITSYVNSYMGYVTTPEEYDIQSYEGGHTVFGRRTFEVLVSAFDPLINELKHERNQSLSIRPFHFPAEELARRSF